MSATEIGGLQRTLETTRAWVGELSEELGTDDATAYRALRATLGALRASLPLAEVADLAAQLPVVLRGLFFDGWQPQRETTRVRRREFLERVGEGLAGSDLDPREAAGAVFALLARRVSPGEVEDLRGVLPRSLRALWPEGGAAREGRTSAAPHGADGPTPLMDHAVGQFMSRSVLVVRESTPLHAALDLMSHAGVRHLLVLADRAPQEPPAHLVSVAGLLSNRDVLNPLRRHPDADVRLEYLLVRDVMSRAPLQTIEATASLAEAARRMHEHRLSALPVVEEERVVGIVTSDDLLYAASLEVPGAAAEKERGERVS